MGLTAQQLVSYTSAVESGTSSLMKSVHSLDSSYIGLDYCNLAKVSSTYSSLFKANNWVLKGQNGAYVYETRFGYNFADIGNPSYQQWIANWIYNDVTTQGFNGVFCDGGLNAYVGELWEFASSPPINPRTGTVWTDQQLQDAYVGLLNAIRAKLGNSLLIVVNGIWDGSRFQAHEAGYEYILGHTNVNGIMGEGWWSQFNQAQWYSEATWKSSLDSLVTLESYFVKGSSSKMFIPCCYIDCSGAASLPAGASTTQVARYGYASTLLGIQSSSDYLLMTNTPSRLQDYYTHYFSLNIGAPLGSYSIVPNTHVYQRSFSNALVLVNPTSTAYNVPLNGHYTDLNGAAVSGTYNMPARTGEVLLDPASPAPPSTPSSGWWNTSWHYRTSITIDHTQVSSDQTNFPLLVDITDPALTTEAQTKGQDFVFIDANNQKLNDQVESYNSATGHLIAWVRIPLLSSTTDTTITMYYGNPTCADQQNPAGVWDSNYLMVQHLQGTSGTQYDSTSNNDNGSPVGAVTEGVSGKIGGCDQFTGGYVSLPQVCKSQTQFTFSAWIYAQSGARYIVSEWAGNQGAFLQVSGDSAVQFYVNGVMVQQSVTLGQWHYVVGTYDGTTARLYLDGGSPASATATSPAWSSQTMYIGDRYDHTRQFIGLIDEVRVSSIARSSSWINTEYTNQNSPSTFYTIGTQQSQS
jgi:hypothetical protein